MTSEHWSLFAGEGPMPVKTTRGSRRVDIEIFVDSGERAADNVLKLRTRRAGADRSLSWILDEALVQVDMAGSSGHIA